MTPSPPTADAGHETGNAGKVAPNDSHIVVRLAPKRVFGVLLLAIGLLVVAGIASNVLKHIFGYQTVFGFIPMFDLDREANIPTWFSSILLFCNAILLGFIAAAMAKRRDRWRWHWGVLAFIFVMLSLDEAASLHERSMGTVRDALDLSRALYFAWVVPAAILLVIFAIVYAPYVFALPRRTRWLFVLAGSIYVAGAMGAEMISAAHLSNHSQKNFTYALISSTEETMEMIGLAIFFYALTDFIHSHFKELTLRFSV